MIAHLLNRDCTLERPQPQADGQGGWLPAWQVVATGRARLRPLRGRARSEAARWHGEITHAVYLAPAMPVQVGDRLHIAGRGFTVLVADLGPSRPDHHRKVLVVERQEAAPWT